MDYKKVSQAALKLRALDHRLRSRIVNILAEEPLTVTQLFIKLRIEQSIVSQQLAILRHQGFVTEERSGKNITYSVNVQELQRISPIISELASCYNDEPRESVWTAKKTQLNN